MLLEPGTDAIKNHLTCSYVMGIGEAEAFSERLKRELQALEAANVHAILESEPLVVQVVFSASICIPTRILFSSIWNLNNSHRYHPCCRKIYLFILLQNYHSLPELK